MTTSAGAGAVPGADDRAPGARLGNPGWVLILVGGVLGVLAAFLTWASVDYGGLASHRYTGVDAGRDGKITIVLAVLVLVVAALAFAGVVRAWQRGVLAVLGLVIAFVAMADLFASPSVGTQEQARLGTTAHITSSNGIGVWLTLLGGVLVVVGTALAGRYARPASVPGD